MGRRRRAKGGVDYAYVITLWSTRSFSFMWDVHPVFRRFDPGMSRRTLLHGDAVRYIETVAADVVLIVLGRCDRKWPRFFREADRAIEEKHIVSRSLSCV